MGIILAHKKHEVERDWLIICRGALWLLQPSVFILLWLLNLVVIQYWNAETRSELNSFDDVRGRRIFVDVVCWDFNIVHTVHCGPDSSVGIATDYGLDGPGSNTDRDKIFRPSRPALGPTQPTVKWVPGLSRGWRRPGRGADPIPI